MLQPFVEKSVEFSNLAKNVFFFFVRDGCWFPLLEITSKWLFSLNRVHLSCKKLEIQCGDRRSQTPLPLRLLPSPSRHSSVSQPHAFWQALALLLSCSCLQSNLIFLLCLPSCSHHLTSISCFLYCCNRCVFSHGDLSVTGGAAQLFDGNRLVCMHGLSHFNLIFSPCWSERRERV